MASRAARCKEHSVTRAPALLGPALGGGSPIPFAHVAATLAHGPAVANSQWEPVPYEARLRFGTCIFLFDGAQGALGGSSKSSFTSPGPPPEAELRVYLPAK